MNFSLLFTFTRQDLIERYSGSILGGLWSFIMPLVNIIIFVLIFSKIMGAKLSAFGIEFTQYGYSIYLVSGVLAWNAFASVVIRTTHLFQEKAGLIGKIKMNLILFPMYILLSESIIFIISMSFFVVFLWSIDFPFTQYWFGLPLIYLIQLILAYALGFLCATLGSFIKDIREIISVIIQFWFWCTPIVYVVNILPDSIQPWFVLNPMYQLIEAYRSLMIYHKMPDLSALALLTTFTLGLFIISLYVFKKLEKDVRDML